MRHSGTNRAKLDVGEDHVGFGLFRLHISGNSGCRRACTTLCARIGRIHRVCGIQPQHVGIVVIPQGHYKNDASINGFSMAPRPPFSSKFVPS